jgi:acyl-coenzyme A synthetase/AMP-(fatty) acid ligase
VIAEKRISVWYSTPSILSLLAQYGKLARHDYSALRYVFFAGEVFPVPQLRAIKAAWSHPRYFNLYGPTETNVCTYYEVPAEIPAERTEPFPIGKTCEHLECKVVDLDGSTVSPGDEGELVVKGPGVMVGYWNLAEQNAAAFLVDPDGTRGTRPATWWSKTRRTATSSTAAGIEWSSGGVTGSSWARSKPGWRPTCRPRK